MPKTIKLESHLSSEELEYRYRKAYDPVLRSHYQILWLISEGKTTAQVMEVTGYPMRCTTGRGSEGKGRDAGIVECGLHSLFVRGAKQQLSKGNSVIRGQSI